MTRFEKFKNMDIKALSEWLDKYVQFDDSPWMKWFDENYCKKCESMTIDMKEYKRIFGCCGYGNTIDCAYCEIKGKCKYFPEMKEIPDNKEIIKMWLESEVEE